MAAKTQETAKKAVEKAEGNYIYIGPTTRTGLVENAVFAGTRESVEAYLKDTIDKLPQVKTLIVESAKLSESRAKVKKTGTILNKYYNDILSLSNKRKEV